MSSPKLSAMTSSIQLKLQDSSGVQHAIDFEVMASPVAQRWLESLRQANQKSFIRDGKRLYNFAGHSVAEEEKVLAGIDSLIGQLNNFFPGLIAENMDRHHPQESINRIHTFFADTHHNNEHMNETTWPIWDRLNSALHGYESFLRSRETEKSANIPECNLIINWEDPVFQDLEEEDYQHFTMAKKFGTCYINYCQTGRHLYEMFLADDAVAQDEHIRPLRRLSADTYIWLGTTTGPKSLARRQLAMKQWFEKHQERLNALGFHWGDPLLALGWVPVAQMSSHGDLQSQQALVSQLAQVQQVISLA